ncbi:MAG: hypothetical protein ABFS32_00890 [Bacteroidota bacterium]
MVYLALAIVLNTLIFALFKIFGLRNVNTFHAIVANYFVCVITGTLFAGYENVLNQPSNAKWIYIALGLGAVFIVVFYLMALTAQRFSMAAASIASKMAFVIPVLFSLYVLKVESHFEWYNFLGVGLALVATYMSSMPGKGQVIAKNKILWLLPALVFIGNGIVDTTINYTNLNFLDETTASVFPVYVFLSAAVIGGLILFLGGKRISLKSIIGGIVLGIANYFTVYAFLLALGQLNNNGALVFPIFNTGIVVLSALAGIIIFREKLTVFNKIGIVIAVLAIIIVML